MGLLRHKDRPRKERRDRLTEPLEHKDTTELAAELDDLLDEIDSVLEENAQAFVDNYRQASGQ